LTSTITERKHQKELEARARRQAMLNQIANTHIAALPGYNLKPLRQNEDS
jgi:hypothetical protein